MLAWLPNGRAGVAGKAGGPGDVGKDPNTLIQGRKPAAGEGVDIPGREG